MSEDIDINAVLAPVEGGNPVGERTFIYKQLMKDKKYEIRVDPIDNTETEIKPNWESIAETSLEALGKTTKDLWIGAVLTEALAHARGFSGFCTGLKIQTGLMRDYWENVYPEKDSEGEDAIEILEPRLNPLKYMNDTLPDCIKAIPLTDTDKSAGCSWLNWQESRGSDGKDSKTAYGFTDEVSEKMTADEFDSAVNDSSREFYESIARDMEQSLEALREFEETVNASFGESVTLMKSSPIFEAEECGIPTEVRDKLKPLSGREFISESEFENELVAVIGEEGASQYKSLILEHANRNNNAPILDKMGDAVERCQKVVTEILDDKRALEPDLEGDVEEETGDDGVGGSGLSSDSAVGSPLSGAGYSSEESREDSLWEEVLRVLKSAGIRKALGLLFEASCSVSSVRGKNRYNLLMAKLCMKAQRPELARPIVEDLYKLIEELNLERWESPTWIAEVYDVLYQCLAAGEEGSEDRSRADALFMKICTIDVTKRI